MSGAKLDYAALDALLGIKDTTLYRLYPDGTVVHQDEFNEYDERYDDYGVHRVPDDPLEMVLQGKRGDLPQELVAHIMDSFTN